MRTGKERWIEQQRADGWQIVAVELAEGAIALPRLEPARRRTVVLLGHEWHGVPEEQVDAADACIEIPMVGTGASLNVAVAGSLVLYRLAGMVLVAVSSASPSRGSDRDHAKRRRGCLKATVCPVDTLGIKATNNKYETSSTYWTFAPDVRTLVA